MKVSNIYYVLNSVMKDILGEVQYVDDQGNAYREVDGVQIPYVSTDDGVTPSWFVKEDCTNIVDVGTKLFAANTNPETFYSQVYASLINHIGRVVYVDRVFKPIIPSLMKNAWEYGSIVEKIDADMPDSEINFTWELEHGKVYEQDRFTAPKNVRAKFFNKAVAFEIDMSYTTEQLKQSFSNLTQLNSFFSMIETKISNKITIDHANLTRATINAFISSVIYSDYHGVRQNNGTYNFATDTNIKTRAINLLARYKAEVPDADATLTAQEALRSPEFIRYAVLQIALYSDRLADVSVLFNIGGKQRFTPKDKQHLILLSEFEKAASVYLQSDTFHEQYTKLPKSETINFWQGTGSDYTFASTSKIHTVSQLPKYVNNVFTEEYESLESSISGIIGVIFDDDAMGINNEKQKITSHYNAKGDFTNNFYKNFAQYFNDHDENMIVFFVA